MKTKIPLFLLSGFLLFLIRCSSELCNTGVGLLDSHCVYENSEEPHFTSLENKRDFFIVGTRGILLHSKNGINWFRKELPWDTEEADIGQLGFLTNRTLHAVTYGNNMLVVAGDWGYIFVSMDRGKTWERADRSALGLPGHLCPRQRLANCLAIFKDIQYGNGWFIGVGPGTTIGRARSPFGPWEFYDYNQLPFDQKNNQFLNQVVYGGGSTWVIQIIPPISETALGLLYSHDNGASWHLIKPMKEGDARCPQGTCDCPRDSCNTDYRNVLFSQGRFVSVASYYFPPPSPLPGIGNRALPTIIISETPDPSGPWFRDSYGDFELTHYRNQTPRRVATDNKGTYIGTNRDAVPFNKFSGEKGWRACNRNECDTDAVDDIRYTLGTEGSVFLGNPTSVFYYNRRWFILHHNGTFSHSTNGKRWSHKKIAHYQLNDMVGF